MPRRKKKSPGRIRSALFLFLTALALSLAVALTFPPQGFMSDIGSLLRNSTGFLAAFAPLFIFLAGARLIRLDFSGRWLSVSGAVFVCAFFLSAVAAMILSRFTPGLLYAPGGALTARMILALDGFWYLTVKDLAGNDKALDRDNWVWDKVMKFYVPELAKLLGVEGRDVADYMKVMQPRPEGLVLEERVEILNRNDAIRTVTYCPTIVAMEKEGEGRDAVHCSATCSEMRKLPKSWLP